MTASKRLYYLDNLRVALTILVIAHHVGQAYGPTGGWWPVQEAARAAVLGPFFSVNRSFFMSLFFMISGYLMVAAYDRNGPRVFVRSRLVRLGVPPLVFAAVMLPLRVYLFQEHIASWVDLLNVGHLWYVEHLLLFSLVYALWRQVRKDPVGAGQGEGPLPGYLAILAFALGVAVMSALVRIWSPIDRWLNLLGFFRVAFADVPRDLGFFIVGAVACRGRWFERYPTRAGGVWLVVGVTAATAWYAYILALQRVFPLSRLAMGVIYPIWEALLCCGMCIGLLVLFREVFNSQGRLGKVLAENQYAAYVWHPMLITGLQAALLAVPLAPLTKFALVTLAGVPLVFLFSQWTRQPRFMRAVL